MANSHVQFRHSKAPVYEDFQKIVDKLGEARPRPTIKVNVSLKDIPHAAIEALLAFGGEHGVEMSMTITAVYDEGQQLTFWDPVHAAGAEA